MRVVVTGGTGLLGRPLVRGLVAGGHHVVVLSRRDLPPPAGTTLELWEPQEEPAPTEVMDGADAVLHLAGEPIANRRWSAAVKQRIVDSRVLGTQNLVAGMKSAKRPPGVLVCASAVGFYGDRGAEELREDSPAGHDFLAGVCAAWEAQARAAEAFNTRCVQVRMGVVLSMAGGALPRMLPPFTLGLGGKLGDGSQYFPWVHHEDAVGLLFHALHNAQVTGPLNAVAPQAVTNAAFTQTLGKVLNRPVVLGVPTAALKLALGELSAALLGSQRAVPQRALDTGYAFIHAQLEPALRRLLHRD